MHNKEKVSVMGEQALDTLSWRGLGHIYSRWLMKDPWNPEPGIQRIDLSRNREFESQSLFIWWLNTRVCNIVQGMGGFIHHPIIRFFIQRVSSTEQEYSCFVYCQIP